ncbi:MAG: UDP-N-acetylmuramate:L-alanyl-gamma-D-glutamyl-meso-diaminopimelate ligase [Myxococcales bacterium]
MSESPPVNLAKVRRIHLMAICGTGMGAFAGMLQAHGYEVRGSDEGAYPPMSERLAAWGIPIMEGFAPENLDWGPDLVIVGNVIRRVNPEATAMRERAIPHMSFPEALSALFLASRHPVVVTGTHGKTTTTSLTAWLLAHAGRSPSFLIGGIPSNFGRSFHLGDGQEFVIEGDEYDTAYFDKGPKFLHYQPRTAILTSIEYDHADIYRDLDHVISAFERFVAIVPPDGALLVCGERELPVRVARGCRGAVETYGVDGPYDWVARDARPDAGGWRFTLEHRGVALGELWSPMAGRHNAQNAVAALGVAHRLGVPLETLAAGLAGFAGVVKRQEVKGEEDGVLVIDDYAHHPTAVAETIDAIRARYPGRPLWALFEAESNTSRRRFFQDDYPVALRGADHVVLSKPLKKWDKLSADEQIDCERIVEDLRATGVDARHIPEFDDIVAWVAEHAVPGDVVLAMSGRNFGGLHGRLLARLNARAASR